MTELITSVQGANADQEKHSTKKNSTLLYVPESRLIERKLDQASFTRHEYDENKSIPIRLTRKLFLRCADPTLLFTKIGVGLLANDRAKKIITQLYARYNSYRDYFNMISPTTADSSGVTYLSNKSEKGLGSIFLYVLTSLTKDAAVSPTETNLYNIFRDGSARVILSVAKLVQQKDTSEKLKPYVIASKPFIKLIDLLTRGGDAASIPEEVQALGQEYENLSKSLSLTLLRLKNYTQDLSEADTLGLDDVTLNSTFLAFLSFALFCIDLLVVKVIDGLGHERFYVPADTVDSLKNFTISSAGYISGAQMSSLLDNCQITDPLVALAMNPRDSSSLFSDYENALYQKFFYYDSVRTAIKRISEWGYADEVSFDNKGKVQNVNDVITRSLVAFRNGLAELNHSLKISLTQMFTQYEQSLAVINQIWESTNSLLTSLATSSSQSAMVALTNFYSSVVKINPLFSVWLPDYAVNTSAQIDFLVRLFVDKFLNLSVTDLDKIVAAFIKVNPLGTTISVGSLASVQLSTQGYGKNILIGYPENSRFLIKAPSVTTPKIDPIAYRLDAGRALITSLFNRITSSIKDLIATTVNSTDTYSDSSKKWFATILSMFSSVPSLRDSIRNCTYRNVFRAAFSKNVMQESGVAVRICQTLSSFLIDARNFSVRFEPLCEVQFLLSFVKAHLNRNLIVLQPAMFDINEEAYLSVKRQTLAAVNDLILKLSESVGSILALEDFTADIEISLIKLAEQLSLNIDEVKDLITLSLAKYSSVAAISSLIINLNDSFSVFNKTDNTYVIAETLRVPDMLETLMSTSNIDEVSGPSSFDSSKVIENLSSSKRGLSAGEWVLSRVQDPLSLKTTVNFVVPATWFSSMSELSPCSCVPTYARSFFIPSDVFSLYLTDIRKLRERNATVHKFNMRDLVSKDTDEFIASELSNSILSLLISPEDAAALSLKYESASLATSSNEREVGDILTLVGISPSEEVSPSALSLIYSKLRSYFDTFYNGSGEIIREGIVVKAAPFRLINSKDFTKLMKDYAGIDSIPLRKIIRRHPLLIRSSGNDLNKFFSFVRPEDLSERTIVEISSKKKPTYFLSSLFSVTDSLAMSDPKFSLDASRLLVTCSIDLSKCVVATGQRGDSESLSSLALDRELLTILYNADQLLTSGDYYNAIGNAPAMFRLDNKQIL